MKELTTAIESTAPSNSSDDEKPKTAPSANPEQMREELVQMAVKFLSHATVKNSPVVSRRSFLEKKGLSTEEIDEAFRRIPEPPPNVTVGQSLASNQDIQSNSVVNIQPQATPQSPTALPTGIISTLAMSSPSQFYWSHAFLVVGLLTASFAGTAIFAKKFVLPRLKCWIRKVVLEEDDGSAKNSKLILFEEVTAAAKTASIAATSAAKASMEILNSKTEERQYFEALVKRLDVQVTEMRSISSTIKKLEGTGEAASSSYNQPDKYFQQLSRIEPNYTAQESSLFDSEDPISYLASSMKVKANGASTFDATVRPSSVPASRRPSVGQHPKSYMEIMAMIQRGEIPPGIKDINDSPPNPDQPLPKPCMAPRSKPWEVAQPYNNGTLAQGLGSTSRLNNSVVPWWHPKNARATELETANGTRANFSDAMTDKQQVQHPWMHSEPSSFAMSKAVDAV